MKKFLSVMMTVMLLASMLMVSAAADDIPVITILCQGDNSPADDNEVIKELEKRLGVKLEITMVPGADYATKLNALMSTNNEPDIYDPNVTTANELKRANRLLNMEPYLAEYGPSILEALGDDIHAAPMNEDGLYGLFSLNKGILENLCIRKDWLAAVGKEMPTTIDELYEVLRAFTFDDPDGNGVNDTYGIAPALDMPTQFAKLFNSFGVHFEAWGFDGNATLLEDGTVTTALKHPRFLEAITFLNKLYHEGIMDPDFATLTGMQGFERLWNSKVGVISFQAQGVTNNWYPGRYTFDVPENPGDLFGFAFIDGYGASKNYPETQDPRWVVSANTKYPELCVKVLDYMYYNTEGQELTFMGIEGTHYEWVDEANGKYQRLGAYTDDVTHRAAGAYVYNYDGGLTQTTIADKLYNKTTQDAQAAENAVALEWPYIPTTLESVLEYDADLRVCVKECIANLIVSTGDLEAELAEYIARWENEGGLEVEEEATAAYKAAQEQ